MIRTATLRVVVPLVLLAACADQSTGPVAAARAGTAPSADAKDSRELATIVWETRTADLIKARSVGPLPAVRAYALVGLAQYAAADAVKKEERRGAVSGASVQVLSYLFRLDIAALESQLLAEGAVGSEEERAEFARGVTAGRAMGDLVVARGGADGFANADGTPKVWDPTTLPAGPTLWHIDAGVVPFVPAGFQFPHMRPYYLTSADQFRSTPPLTDLTGPVNEVIEIVRNRTAAQAASAVALNLGPGTISALGAWDLMAVDFIKERNMDERAAAHVYALVNTATMDAVIGCWETKYHYLTLRPWQVAPADLPNSSLIIGRPNHPSYPSGHSCVSAAAATVLERFFPENRTTLEQQVADNGMSRIYAGIHYRMDVEAGQELGRSVAKWAIHFDNTNGLLAALLPHYRGNDDR